jgi:hypothetical protein
MSALTEALDRLIEQHRRIGSPVDRFLRPGIDPGDARAGLAALGIAPRDDLVELYTWHDGCDEDAYRDAGAGVGYPRLFANVFFGPFAMAVDHHRENLEIDRNTVAMSGDPAAATWRINWFPPFSGGSPVYAVDCDESGPTPGAVYEVYWHPPIEEPVRPRFRDLTHLVQAVETRFHAGGYDWDRSTRILVARPEVLEPLYAREIAEARP